MRTPGIENPAPGPALIHSARLSAYVIVLKLLRPSA
jgi:hypothetical protein